MKRRVSTGLLVLQASVVLVVILLAGYAVARGQGVAPAEASVGASAAKGEAVPAAPFDQSRFDRLRAEGAEALMNLDYEGATARFREMAREFPDHPGGPQYLAAALWLKTLNGSRRLQSNIYNDDSFYEGAEDKVDPKIISEFKDLTRRARLLADARLRRNPEDADALYFLGVIEGLKAAFEAAVERRFVGALRDSKDSVEFHRRLLKLDPNFHDAELTVGMYDYIVGGLPWLYKQVVRVVASGGSKKKGIAALERVVREGRWAKDDARVMLIPIYKRERRFADAVAVTRELATKYPRNYIFKLEAADALVSQAETLRATAPAEAAKLEQEAFATFESLLRDRAAARQSDQIHFQYAAALANANQHERAAREYTAAASTPNVDPALATMALLRAAQSFDLAGKRADALAQYKAVLARPDVYKSHESAQKGLKEPYRKGADAGQSASEGAGAKDAAAND